MTECRSTICHRTANMNSRGRLSLLGQYERLLKLTGPDSDAAYDLLMSHFDEAEFIRLAEAVCARHIERQKALRIVLILAPLYICLAVAFLLMMWLG
jgi:hypothetical protein